MGTAKGSVCWADQGGQDTGGALEGERCEKRDGSELLDLRSSGLVGRSAIAKQGSWGRADCMFQSRERSGQFSYRLLLT